MSDWFQDVLDFHRKFGCHVGTDGPAAPSFSSVFLRAELMGEEYQETIRALYLGDIAGLADGLADLIYVAIGTAISYGIDLRPVWDAVQESNMAKEGGPTREDGKILKPPGWQPPDIAGILAAQAPLEAKSHD